MKYLKYTLLLIILLTFVSVRAETCTYEEKQQLAEKVDLSKFKLTYVKGDEKLGGFIKAEMDLDNDYYAIFTAKGYQQLISHGYYAIIYDGAGGKSEVEVFSNNCSIYKHEFFLPYYNSKNKNIFDDGSIIVKTSTRVTLIICALVLVMAAIFLARRSIKYENIS